MISGRSFRALTWFSALLWLAVLVWSGWRLVQVADAAPAAVGSMSDPAASARHLHLDESAERVTLVLAQGLTWADLDQVAAAVDSSGFSGTRSFVTVVTAGWALPQHAYLTLATGAPALFPETDLPPLDSGADRGDSLPTYGGSQIHEQLTGVSAEDAAVLLPAAVQISKVNRNRSPAVRPGLLAEKLQEHGLKTAVLGEADLPFKELNRWAAAIAMDPAGRVAYGRLAGFSVTDPTSPSGRRQNWPALVRAWRALPADTGLVVIESGDLLRLERLHSLAADHRLAAAREAALLQLSTGLKLLLQAARDRPGRQPVWLLAPAPPAVEGGQPQGFGVLWLWSEPGREGVLPSLITSPSTRRQGLVALTDIAPTIVADLGIGIDPSEWIGRPVPLTGESDLTAEQVTSTGTELERKLLANHSNRVHLIQSYVSVIIVLLAIAVAALKWRQLAGVVVMAAPALAAVPVAYLLLPLLGADDLFTRAAATIILAAATAVVARALGTAAVFISISFVLIAVILADLAGGANVVVSSPLGYSLLVGARYYGIGNEYAGFMIGSVAAASGLACDLLRHRPGGFFPFVTVLLPVTLSALFMLPFAGANFGCGLAAGVTAATFFVRLLPRGAWWRQAAFAAALTGLLLFAVLLDSASGSVTHIGRAVNTAFTGEGQAVLNIAKRKLQLNWRLIRYTIWTRVFLVSLAATAAFLLRPAPGLSSLWQRKPGLHAGLIAAVAGSAAALVLNDSGIVAAATAMIMPTAAAAHALLSAEGTVASKAVLEHDETVPEGSC